ncbi:lytic murein transglycosylase [Dongia mobilis]|uniref:Lytic murein transglycosylase n=1 Tax=Dongia mobilis TaxID=578943 RepID=A0A4R6WJL5_9PROT|nr:lytic murein transglycosylase [Dongia mobilis]TDQ80592.1 lytic murein transglycosylase [Dongia mobilis]
MAAFLKERRWYGATLLAAALMGGCAATPSATATQPAASAPASEQAPAEPGATPATASLAVPDMTTLTQTTCPKEASSYEEWVARFGAYALHQGQPEQVIRTAFAGVYENPEIRDRAAKQPEFVTPVWTYLDRAVSAERIAKGQARLPENRAILAEIERDFGTNANILMGIWGIETDFGNNFGNVNVFEALSNVGYGTRRKDFACTELLSALKIAAKGYVAPKDMIGSWAGAMGHSQFLPSNYLTIAVDRDRSGAPDLWTSMPDVFASTANHLVRDGWQRGLPWGFEVKLPAGFPYQNAELDITKPISEWKKLGVTRFDGSPLPALAGDTSILLLAGHKGPAFLTTQNFKAILKYNYSTSYALSVAYLGDRVMGGKGIQGRWPVDEPPLNLEEREEIQQRLVGLGHLEGAVDGVIGLKTRKAIRLFQLQAGLPADGFATKSLLLEMRRRMAG